MSIKDHSVIFGQRKTVGHVEHALVFSEAIGEVRGHCAAISQVFVVAQMEVEQSGASVRVQNLAECGGVEGE